MTNFTNIPLAYLNNCTCALSKLHRISTCLVHTRAVKHLFVEVAYKLRVIRGSAQPKRMNKKGKQVTKLLLREKT